MTKRKGRTGMQELTGLGVAPGIAVGRAVCIETRAVEVYRFPLAPDEIEAEVERFQRATRNAQEEIHRIRDKVRRKMGEELAAVFEAHALFLEDPSFLERIAKRIRSEHVNAEWAVYRTAEDMGERFAALEDPYFRDRREDLRDVTHQLLRSLQGISHHELSEIEGEVVIVADELTPSDALRLGREQVRGFAIETGGRTSHTTIIARSLNIPAVIGIEGLRELVTDEDPVILDGESGTVILHPTAEVLRGYEEKRHALEEWEEASVATRTLAACTEDGVEVALMANVDLPEELDAVVRFGAAGIGLYRSEFLYIEKSPGLPSEEEHLALYRRLAEVAAPHPAIIRTYDLGGRKLARELLHVREENPVLGLRGIRLTLARPDIFRTQLRALFRAAVHGDVWVMVPMVATLEEVRRFREFAAEVCRELEREGVEFRRDLKLGIMIEVPSAALIADRLAREVDFFSIGTNDLIQYALAVDRNNEHVVHLYQPLHPALLRMLRFVVESAREAGIEVAVCGEMAADPGYAAVLLGLGLRRLSVNPRSVPEIKTRLRQLSVCDLRDAVEGCLDLGGASEVEQHLKAFLAPAAVPTPVGPPGGQEPGVTSVEVEG